MPGRIRSVKPDFWTDPAVVALPAISRLFFIGSWNFADDYGVLKDDPERLRLQILPSDQVDAGAIVDELVAAQLLLRMRASDGTAVLVIRTFCAHQRIDSRATGRWGKPDTFAEQDESDPAQSRAIPPENPLDRKGLDGTGGDCAGSPDDERSAKQRRRRQLPNDFTLTDERKAKAVAVGLPPSTVAGEFEKFCNHHRGKGSTMIDWDAAWRYWLGNYRGPRAAQSTAQPDYDEAWRRSEEREKAGLA